MFKAERLMVEQHSKGFGVTAISNPLSGKNKNNGYRLFTHTIEQFEQIRHLTASNPKDISRAIKACEMRQDRVIIVNGGDGTLQCILTLLKQRQYQHYQPELCLLGSGTTSMSYQDIGCKGKLENILSSLSDYSQGLRDDFKRFSREILRVEIVDTHEVHCGMFFGAGTIYDGVLYCRKSIHSKGLRGELGASLGMVRFLLDWLTVKRLTRSVTVKFCIDNTHRDSAIFSVIVATTLNRLLSGVYPFWSTCSDRGQFVITFIKRNPPRLVMNFYNILKGRAPKYTNNDNHYQSYAPNQAELFIEGAFTLDGELFGEQGKTTQLLMDSAGKVTFLSL